MTTYNEKLSILRFTNESFVVIEKTLKVIEDIFTSNLPAFVHINIANIDGGIVENYDAIIGYLKMIKQLTNVKFNLYVVGYVMSAGINILCSDIFENIYVDSHCRIVIHQFGAHINDRKFRNHSEIENLKSQIDVSENAQNLQIYSIQKKMCNKEDLPVSHAKLSKLLDEKKKGDVHVSAIQWLDMNMCTSLM